jgi:hypothetical protein
MKFIELNIKEKKEWNILTKNGPVRVKIIILT